MKFFSMQMNIDDYETIQTTGTGTKKILDTNTPLYFGNTDLSPPEGLVGSTVPLEGCIGDVTINGEYVLFLFILFSCPPLKKRGSIVLLMSVGWSVSR